MGAGMPEIMYGLSRGFLTIILVALAIGLPFGFFIGEQFLEQYAYRISIGAEILLGSASVLLVIGCLIIGWQTWKAAIQNPIKNLRSE
jgi:putative ABC transport system permease protein